MLAHISQSLHGREKQERKVSLKMRGEGGSLDLGVQSFPGLSLFLLHLGNMLPAAPRLLFYQSGSSSSKRNFINISGQNKSQEDAGMPRSDHVLVPGPIMVLHGRAPWLFLGSPL